MSRFITFSSNTIYNIFLFYNLSNPCQLQSPGRELSMGVTKSTLLRASSLQFIAGEFRRQTRKYSRLRQTAAQIAPDAPVAV